MAATTPVRSLPAAQWNTSGKDDGISEDAQRTADAVAALAQHLEIASGEELGRVDVDIERRSRSHVVSRIGRWW